MLGSFRCEFHILGDLILLRKKTRFAMRSYGPQKQVTRSDSKTDQC